MRLENLLRDICKVTVIGDENKEITGVNIDSLSGVFGIGKYSEQA